MVDAAGWPNKLGVLATGVAEVTPKPKVVLAAGVAGEEPNNEEVAGAAVDPNSPEVAAYGDGDRWGATYGGSMIWSLVGS